MGAQDLTRRATERAVGVLFVVATVASIAGGAVQGSVLDDADYLPGVAAHEGRVVGAVFLYLIAATAAVMTAVLLLPILRRGSEAPAVGYVVLRTFENVLYVISAVAMLAMVTVSQSDAAAGVGGAQLSLVGSGLLALRDWSVSVGTLLFAGLGSTTLNWVLHRRRLVPRWLSTWGIAGALLLVCYGVIGIAGGPTDLGSPLMVLAMPIAVQELVFAGWLIARGLDPVALGSGGGGAPTASPRLQP